MAASNTTKTKCPECGKRFDNQGYPNHLKAHARRNGKAPSAPPRPSTAVNKVINNYLRSLKEESNGYRKPRFNEAQLAERIVAAEEAGQYLKAVKLTQQRYNLEVEDYEAGFINVALLFSEENGISRAAWQEMGVPTKVLKAAGL